MLGLVNYFGVRFGGGVQVAMTAVKVALIAFLIMAGMFYAHPAAAGAAPPKVPPLATGFVAALVAALWAYDGWNNVGMVASEIKNPGRNLPIALIGEVAGDWHLHDGELGLFPRADACGSGCE